MSRTKQFEFATSRPAEDRGAIFNALRTFALEQRWPKAVADEVELILEEWVTNIIAYGAVGNSTPDIRVELRPCGDCAEIAVSDNGIPFDPTKHATPDLGKPADERPIGGLGIHMMRKLSERMEYVRDGECNRLTIVKNVREPALGRAKAR